MPSRSLVPDICVSTFFGLLNVMCFAIGRRWYNGAAAALLLLYAVILDDLNSRRARGR